MARSDARKVLCLSLGLLFGSILATSCTVALDAGSLESGCPTNTKLCDGTCVAADDPELGCGRTTCQPCALPRASSVCGPDGECLVASCSGSYENCNDDSRDGCEVNTDSDPQHCGSCNAAPCTLANALPDCSAGLCAILRCITGYKDCDGRADNGCEVVLSTDRNNCGDCNTRCSTGQSCSSGTCG